MCTLPCRVWVRSLLTEEPPLGRLSVPSQECAEFKQQPHSAPSLPPLSSQQLGAIFLLLCVSVMGKGPDHHRRGTSKQLHWVAKQQRSSGPTANIGSERARRGLIKEGEALVRHTSSICAKDGCSPQLQAAIFVAAGFVFRVQNEGGA